MQAATFSHLPTPLQEGIPAMHLGRDRPQQQPHTVESPQKISITITNQAATTCAMAGPNVSQTMYSWVSYPSQFRPFNMFFF
jgi:hypothetical protein